MEENRAAPLPPPPQPSTMAVRKKTKPNLKTIDFDAAIRDACNSFDASNTDLVTTIGNNLLNYRFLAADIFAQMLALCWLYLGKVRLTHYMKGVVERRSRRCLQPDGDEWSKFLTEHIQVDIFLYIFEEAIREWHELDKPSTLRLMAICFTDQHEHTALCCTYWICEFKNLSAEMDKLKFGAEELLAKYLVPVYKSLRLEPDDPNSRLLKSSFLLPIMDINKQLHKDVYVYVRSLTEKMRQLHISREMIAIDEIREYCSLRQISMDSVFQHNEAARRLLEDESIKMQEVSLSEPHRSRYGYEPNGDRTMVLTRETNACSTQLDILDNGDMMTLTDLRNVLRDSTYFMLQLREMSQWDSLAKQMWCSFQQNKRGTAKFYFNVLDLYQFTSQTDWCLPALLKTINVASPSSARKLRPVELKDLLRLHFDLQIGGFNMASWYRVRRRDRVDGKKKKSRRVNMIVMSRTDKMNNTLLRKCDIRQRDDFPQQQQNDSIIDVEAKMTSDELAQLLNVIGLTVVPLLFISIEELLKILDENCISYTNFRRSTDMYLPRVINRLKNHDRIESMERSAQYVFAKMFDDDRWTTEVDKQGLWTVRGKEDGANEDLAGYVAYICDNNVRKINNWDELFTHIGHIRGAAGDSNNKAVTAKVSDDDFSCLSRQTDHECYRVEYTRTGSGHADEIDAQCCFWSIFRVYGRVLDIAADDKPPNITYYGVLNYRNDHVEIRMPHIYQREKMCLTMKELFDQRQRVLKRRCAIDGPRPTKKKKKTIENNAKQEEEGPTTEDGPTTAVEQAKKWKRNQEKQEKQAYQSICSLSLPLGSRTRTLVRDSYESVSLKIQK